MKLIDRAYLRGDLSDEEVARRDSEYVANRLIGAKLFDAGADLLVGDLGLNDGIVESSSCEDGVFTLCVLAGDLQRGYESATLTYSGAELTDDEPGTVAQRLHRGTELLADELTRVGGWRYEHSFIMVGPGAFSVTFRSVQVQRSPVGADERARLLT